jgi:hypothetical protein
MPALAIILATIVAGTAYATPTSESDVGEQNLKSVTFDKPERTNPVARNVRLSSGTRHGLAFSFARAATPRRPTASRMSEEPNELGLCASHPGAFPGLNPVLVHSWLFPIRVVQNRSYTQAAIYVPRLCNVTFVEMTKPTSGIFKGLDYFFPGFFPPFAFNSSRAVSVRFNRPAKVFVLIHASYNWRNPENATLPGYKSLGWAEVPKDKNVEIKYGVYKTVSRNISSRAYVVYKDAPNSVASLPDAGWILQNLKGISIPTNTVSYSVLFAEADGSASVAPESPPGVGPIPTGGRCPSALHDLWTTPGNDDSDYDTADEVFSTWHPMWDPCYYCAYDHEHGSNAGALLGISPAYSLPAWKNYRQDENHNGFKVSGRVPYGEHPHAGTAIMTCSDISCSRMTAQIFFDTNSRLFSSKGTISLSTSFTWILASLVDSLSAFTPGSSLLSTHPRWRSRRSSCRSLTMVPPLSAELAI